MTDNDEEELRKGILSAKLEFMGLILADNNNNDIQVNSCYINRAEIKTLSEYLSSNGLLTTDTSLNYERINDRFVIPIILLDGRKIELEVQETQFGLVPEMAVFYRMERDGNYIEEYTSSIIGEEINNYINDVLKASVISSQEIERNFVPENMLDLARKISDGTLFPPKDPKKIIDIIQSPNEHREKISSDRSDDYKTREEKSQYSSSQESSLDSKEGDEQDENISEEMLDEMKKDVAMIFSQDEELRRSCSRLKQVLKVDAASSVIDNIQEADSASDSGINRNEPITIYRFATSGARLQDRIVILQGDRITDERKYDSICGLMDGINNQSVNRLTDTKSKIKYIDFEGKEHETELVKKPDDLSEGQKQTILDKMDELDNQSNVILKSTDLTIEQKIKGLKAINNKRLKLFKEYGVILPEIESKIIVDNTKLEEAENGKSGGDTGNRGDDEVENTGEHLPELPDRNKRTPFDP